MSSGFITESEAVEVRKKRQEEWERVRQADDPLERPQESFDGRSLFDRLQEQKQKKDLEYEEAHKLKNMIKGLDDDEIEFLDLVDRTKLAADRRKEIEEELELNDYRNRVAILQEKSITARIHNDIVVTKPKAINAQRNVLQKQLKGVVIKKADKRKISETSSEEESSPKKQSNVETVPSAGKSSALKCVAVLPGLGCYDDSSTDENSSSDSEVDKHKSSIDLLGRKVVIKPKE